MHPYFMVRKPNLYGKKVGIVELNPLVAGLSALVGINNGEGDLPNDAANHQKIN